MNIFLESTFALLLLLFPYAIILLVYVIGWFYELKSGIKVERRHYEETQKIHSKTSNELFHLQLEHKELQREYTKLHKEYEKLTPILEQLSFDLPAFDWQDQDDVSRLYNALRDNLEAECKDITATFESRSPKGNGEPYKTTLTGCECKDFTYNNKRKTPCKHMFALALRMNAELSPLKGVDRQTILEYTELKKDVDKEKREIKKIVSTTSQRSPWLAKRIAEYYDQIDRERIASIPRSTKKEELDRLRREKKQLLIERNELQSQLDYLIQTFPEIRICMSEPPNI